MTKKTSLYLLVLLGFLILPATSQALVFKIKNQSNRSADKVFVTVAGEAGSFDVPGMTNDQPKRLSAIADNKIAINRLVSGRIYISYGAGVKSSVPFTSKTRFDWAELSVNPSSSDVANLTAVDQFGIGMRLNTYDGTGKKLETIGAANSNKVFAALRQIPGGAKATVKNNGKIIRVVSPNHSDAYPRLGKYVRSMAGKKVTLKTAFFGAPFTTSSYSGTFQADGSIVLTGATNPGSIAPSPISIDGSQLIKDIYTGANTPNNLQGAIRRDLLAGFSTGLWGGRYGNNALNFCSNPMTTAQGSWCPNGFNKPSFGSARKSLSPYPTCEQYSAVINKYSDSYGNPYSDASKKVTVSINQPGTGGKVKTLALTILPDRGRAKPVASGNANCGAKLVSIDFKKIARLKKGKISFGKTVCLKTCGKVVAVAKSGKKVVGKRTIRKAKKEQSLLVGLNRFGKKKFAGKSKLKLRFVVKVNRQGKTFKNQRALVVKK